MIGLGCGFSSIQARQHSSDLDIEFALALLNVMKKLKHVQRV